MPTPELLNSVIDNYLEWLNAPTVLLFKHKTTNQILQVSPSKRGNAKYHRKTHFRFKSVSDMLPRERHKSKIMFLSKYLYITLTFDPKNLTIGNLWSSKYLSKESLVYSPHTKKTIFVPTSRPNEPFVTLESSHHFKNLVKWETKPSLLSRSYDIFRKRLERLFGNRLFFIKVNESHHSGYAHIHLVIYNPNENQCFQRHINPKKPRGKQLTYRLVDRDLKNGIKSLWEHGFCDVQGVYDSGEKGSISPILSYLGKDLVKSTRVPYLRDGITSKDQFKRLLTLSLCWLYRRRSFSMSNPDLINLGLSHRIKQLKDPSEWEYLGCFIALPTKSQTKGDFDS